MKKVKIIAVSARDENDKLKNLDALLNELESKINSFIEDKPFSKVNPVKLIKDKGWVVGVYSRI